MNLPLGSEKQNQAISVINAIPVKESKHMPKEKQIINIHLKK